MSCLSYRKRGLTLIEILIAIGIMAVLIALVTVSYTGAQRQSRDSQRKSDLNQYRLALENFATANDSFYPAFANRAQAAVDPCASVLEPIFMSDCPLDPSSLVYYYRSDGGVNDGSAVAIDYVLWVQLEKGTFWEVCSDGRSGELPASQSPAVTDSDNDGGCAVP